MFLVIALTLSVFFILLINVAISPRAARRLLTVTGKNVDYKQMDRDNVMLLPRLMEGDR